MRNILSNFREMAQQSRKEKEIIEVINNNFVSKKCFRQGCHKQVLNGCSHNQCSYHHNELCVKKKHSDTMHGYCELIKVRR